MFSFECSLSVPSQNCQQQDLIIWTFTFNVIDNICLSFPMFSLTVSWLYLQVKNRMHFLLQHAIKLVYYGKSLWHFLTLYRFLSLLYSVYKCNSWKRLKNLFWYFIWYGEIVCIYLHDTLNNIKRGWYLEIPVSDE